MAVFITVHFLYTGAWSEAATYFYVDPNFNGTTRNGGKTTPWRDTELNWATINKALDTGDVTIYFSCANYTGNGEKISTIPIDIQRTSTSDYRLVLDGNSYYNTSQNEPASWAANPGSYRYRIIGSRISQGESYWNTINPQRAAAKYITIKGFHITGNGSGNGIFIHGIDHLVVTENVLDKCRFFHTYSCVKGKVWNGGVRDVTISYNTISGPTGNEAFYFGGQAPAEGGDLCSNVWDEDVTIEYNVFDGATPGDGDGDGLDIKAGKKNLIVRYNIFRNCKNRGMVSHSGGLYYGNIAYNNGEGGMIITSFLGDGINWGIRPSEVTMYNNVAYNNTGGPGISVEYQGGDRASNVKFYNNSLSGNSLAIVSMRGNGITGDFYIKNNIASAASFASIGGKIYGGYNNFYGTLSGYTRTEGDLNVDPQFISSTNLQLQAGSPCINAGANLSSEFTTDALGYTRNIGNWDMGAYEYGASGGGGDPFPPAAPTNLRIISN